MLGYIDWIIILIALLAAGGALLLLYPQSNQQDKDSLYDLRKQAEINQKRIQDVLDSTQAGAKDAENLVQQLRQHVNKAGEVYQSSQVKASEAEAILERVSIAEKEMRDISTQLGERLAHLQGYWDEQLGDSVSSVRKIRSQLKESLGQVDDSLTRLHEQERMAQGFTRKLLDYHQEQARSQQDNSRLSKQVHERLEDMLVESTHLLDRMKRYQQDADAIFARFSDDMASMEGQAGDALKNWVDSSDSARKELQASLDETQQHLGTMRLREAQSDELERKIRQHFEEVEKINVAQLSKNLDLTDQMSDHLHKGVEQARNVLSTLQQAVQGVTANLTERLPVEAANAPLTKAEPESEAEVEEIKHTELVSADNSALKLAEVADLKTFREGEVNTDNEQAKLLALRAYR
jgi:chromosome segregation ATPase